MDIEYITLPFESENSLINNIFQLKDILTKITKKAKIDEEINTIYNRLIDKYNKNDDKQLKEAKIERILKPCLANKEYLEKINNLLLLIILNQNKSKFIRIAWN